MRLSSIKSKIYTTNDFNWLKNTLDFFINNLGFCLELGFLNSETEIGTEVA